jgi:hypothetical protein
MHYQRCNKALSPLIDERKNQPYHSNGNHPNWSLDSSTSNEGTHAPLKDSKPGHLLIT